MMTPHGAFAEYAVAPENTTFHIPGNVSFEEAATVPLAGYTAVCALFQELNIREPWASKTNTEDDSGGRGILIYGASTATGAFAVKLAAAAGIHPIIAVGSPRSEFVRPFLDEKEGDVLVDYTAYSGEELVAVLRGLCGRGGCWCWRAFDSVSEDETIRLVTRVLTQSKGEDGRKPRVTNILMKREVEGADPGVEIVCSYVGQVHEHNEKDRLLGAVWGAAFSRGLRERWLTGHPYTVQKGLESIEGGLKGLKNGTVRAQKVLTAI